MNLATSFRLFEEAQELSPGGFVGMRGPSHFVPGEYPVFLDRGRGGHVVDVDGNDYIDLLCGYGPIILGYAESEIDEAVVLQMRNGFCLSLCQSLQNKLARRLIDLVPCAEMAVLVKTGSDATTAAVRIARAYTGRDKIARCGYHGWHDWCVENHGGIPAAVLALTKEFDYGDPSDLERVFAENPNEIAGVIITPLGHPFDKPIELPPPGYLEAVKEIAHAHRALLIFDEIRTGFRAAMGGAQELYGVTPDLTAVGKAMANGYAIAAVVGRSKYMQVLDKKAGISSTYFPNSLEMAAALKTLEILERERALATIWEQGDYFLKRVQNAVDESHVPVTVSGIPPMPFLTFDDCDGHREERRKLFYTECIRRGVLLQPYHHCYICYRHTKQDLDSASEAIAEALLIVAGKLPFHKNLGGRPNER